MLQILGSTQVQGKELYTIKVGNNVSIMTYEEYKRLWGKYNQDHFRR